MGAELPIVRVLQVEDDPVHYELVRALLKHAQLARFIIDRVDRVSHAIETLRKQTFDVVLLDLALPDGRGLEILDAVLPVAGSAAVVIHTGSDDQATCLAALNRGAQDYLVKAISDGRAIERAILYSIERKRAQAVLWSTEAELVALSLTDELTGLCNRRGVFLLGEQLLKLAARNRSPASVLFSDLDGLKETNDRLGHAAGDRLLCAYATIMRASVRDSDVVGRLGGDEFAIVGMGGDGRLLAQRLKEAVFAESNAPERPARLSVSIGVAVFDPANPQNLVNLIAHADEQMYHQKRQAGRAHWQRQIS